MMNHTDYNICASNILLMKKILQLLFTEMIYYLQFVKKNIDTDLVQKLIQGYLRKLDPEAEHNWVLYGKVTWEGYSKKKFNNRKD